MAIVPSDVHHATIRAALREMRKKKQLWLLLPDDHPILANIDTTLQWLDTLAARQEWTPITGHIIMCISGEIQDVQAHSISGLPLPANVAVCKLTQPNKENSDLE